MIAKCPHCSALLECTQSPGETVDCAGCGHSFRAEAVSVLDADAIQRKAASVGINRVAGPPAISNRLPWSDSGIAMFVPLVAGVAIPLVLIKAGKQIAAYAIVSIVGGFMFLWGFQLLRACAHRLRHIEELLARR